MESWSFMAGRMSTQPNPVWLRTGLLAWRRRVPIRCLSATAPVLKTPRPRAAVRLRVARLRPAKVRAGVQAGFSPADRRSDARSVRGRRSSPVRTARPARPLSAGRPARPTRAHTSLDRRDCEVLTELHAHMRAVGLGHVRLVRRPVRVGLNPVDRATGYRLQRGSLKGRQVGAGDRLLTGTYGSGRIGPGSRTPGAGRRRGGCRRGRGPCR